MKAALRAVGRHEAAQLAAPAGQAINLLHRLEAAGISTTFGPARGVLAGLERSPTLLEAHVLRRSRENQGHEHHKLQGDRCAHPGSSPAPGIRSAHGLRINSRHVGSCWWDGVAVGTHQFRTSAGESKSQRLWFAIVRLFPKASDRVERLRTFLLFSTVNPPKTHVYAPPN